MPMTALNTGNGITPYFSIHRNALFTLFVSYHTLTISKEDTSGVGKVFSSGKSLFLLSLSFTFCKIWGIIFIFFPPWVDCENFINICIF